VVKEDKKYSAYKEKIPIFELWSYAHNANGEYELDPFIGFKLKKILKKYKNEIILETNSLGLRSEELNLIDSVDTIFLGSSFVYGAYCPLQKLTFSEIYGKLYNKRTLNAGVGGHILPQHLSLYFNYLKNIKTKNVVLFAGYNEFSAFYLYKKNYGDLIINFQEIVKNLHSKPIICAFTILLVYFKKQLSRYLIYFKTLLSRFNFIKKIYHYFFSKNKNLTSKSENLANKSENSENEKLDNYIDFFYKDIDCLKDFFVKKGINFYFILQPSLVFKKNKSEAEIDIFKSLGETKINNLEYFYNRIKNKFQSSAFFYDFTNVFDNEKESIFVDNAHVADKGNKIIANKLSSLLS
tara:strand:+ start:188 stop:1243 length:1056 start_codon:yes stop_codon:yes gene_type:complete